MTNQIKAMKLAAMYIDHMQSIGLVVYSPQVLKGKDGYRVVWRKDKNELATIVDAETELKLDDWVLEALKMFVIF